MKRKKKEKSFQRENHMEKKKIIKEECFFLFHFLFFSFFLNFYLSFSVADLERILQRIEQGIRYFVSVDFGLVLFLILCFH